MKFKQMKIILNNRKEIITAEKITLSDLIKIKNFTFRFFIKGIVIIKYFYTFAPLFKKNSSLAQLVRASDC